MTSKTSILMLLAIAVVGIYVLPSVTARFSGSHTMEFNATSGARVRALDCEMCHTYIIGELGSGPSATSVLAAHRNAAGVANYVNGSGLLNITESDALDENVNRSACMLCHLVTRDRGALNQTHTKITIRVCTDSKCHGANIEVGTSTYPYESNVMNVTAKLAVSTDAHSNFFNPLNGTTSFYPQQGSSSNYTRGFYACMACHTHVGLSFNVSRPNAVIFNFTANIEGNENMTGFTFDRMLINTSRNATVGLKMAGVSIWS